tara:strand:- start:1146 stop:1322 length:177 start_codon:yes stop_codon:yes gene_type:complete
MSVITSNVWHGGKSCAAAEKEQADLLGKDEKKRRETEERMTKKALKKEKALKCGYVLF